MMTTVATASRRRSAAPAIADLAAPALVVVYVVLKFQPFELLAQPPGAASSVLFPVAGIVSLVLTPADRLSRAPVSLAVAAFVVWLGVSRLWTESQGSTEFFIRSELPALLILMLLVGTIPVDVLVRTLVAMVTVIGVWSLITSLVLPSSRQAVIDAALEEPQLGFRGTFGHKNQLGIFMVFALCLVLARVHGRGRTVLLLLCVGVVIGTRSATAGSGLLAVLFFWLWIGAIRSRRSSRERTVLVAFSFASALASVLLALRLLPTILGLYEKDLTFSGRTLIWAEAIDKISRQPLHGYGYGGLWVPEPPPITVEMRRNIGFDAAHAHNGAIALLLEVGLIGLALFAFVLVSAVSLVVYCIRRPALANYGLWGALVTASFALMSVAEPLFETPYLAMLVIVITVLAKLRNDSRRSDPHVLQPLGRRSSPFGRDLGPAPGR